MNEKLIKLSEIAQSNLERRQLILINENYTFKNVAYGQTLANWANGWNEFLNNKNIENTKLFFNENGFLDLKRAELFNHRLFDMQNPRDSFCCVALSDHHHLIQLYSEIDYEIKYTSRNKEIKISFREYTNKGELTAIYSLCILNVLKKDLAELKKSLSVFKDTLEKVKDASILRPDYEFLESLLTPNKDIMKDKIEYFLAPKLHAQRMQDELILKDFISQPALLYLKLCWMLDYEIEIKNKYIPMELMPIVPLKKYNETYKEFL